MLMRARRSVIQSYHPQTGLSCIQCFIRRQNSYSVAEKQCYYDVLGVTQKADKKEIRDAYVAKTKEFHPDRNINDPGLHDQFVQVNEAYTVLGDEAKRIEYDETKSNFSRVSYSSFSASAYSPFGNARAGGGVDNNFNPTFQAFYDNDPYAKNMYRDFQFAKEKYRYQKRSRNKQIILIAIAFMLTGSGLHFLHIRFFRNRWKEHEDRVLQQNISVYDSVREKARLNGARKQLQLLASSKSVPDSSSSKFATDNA